MVLIRREAVLSPTGFFFAEEPATLVLGPEEGPPLAVRACDGVCRSLGCVSRSEGRGAERICDGREVRVLLPAIAVNSTLADPDGRRRDGDIREAVLCRFSAGKGECA